MVEAVYKEALAFTEVGGYHHVVSRANVDRYKQFSVLWGKEKVFPRGGVNGAVDEGGVNHPPFGKGRGRFQWCAAIKELGKIIQQKAHVGG